MVDLHKLSAFEDSEKIKSRRNIKRGKRYEVYSERKNRS